jgi:AraC family transcriptional regulator
VPGGLSAAQLNRVADFIEAHLHKTLSLADIARACALSPTYFARQFKDTTGLPPHQFLIQMRIERAKRLLKDRPRLWRLRWIAASPIRSISPMCSAARPG